MRRKVRIRIAELHDITAPDDCLSSRNRGPGKVTEIILVFDAIEVSGAGCETDLRWLLDIVKCGDDRRPGSLVQHRHSIESTRLRLCGRIGYADDVAGAFNPIRARQRVP